MGERWGAAKKGDNAMTKSLPKFYKVGRGVDSEGFQRHGMFRTRTENGKTGGGETKCMGKIA